jgi:hypothetical protein
MAEYYPQSDPMDSPPQSSTLAIISLVAGIASFIFLPFLAGVAAVITGHMAKREIRDSGGRKTGEGLATGGMILGYANLVLSVLCICGFAAFFLFAAQSGSTYNW